MGIITEARRSSIVDMGAILILTSTGEFTRTAKREEA